MERSYSSIAPHYETPTGYFMLVPILKWKDPTIYPV